MIECQDLPCDGIRINIRFCIPITGINVNVAFASLSVGLVRFIRVKFTLFLFLPLLNDAARVTEGEVFVDFLLGSSLEEIFLTTRTNISKFITSIITIGISFQ